jgi:hypothetical protein
LTAENGGRISGKGTQETGVWRETVVYPVFAQPGCSSDIQVRDESYAYQESPAASKEEIHGTVKLANIPRSEAHDAHVLTTVVEYCNESSNNEHEEEACRDIDTDGNSSDVSSNEEEEEEEEEEEDSESENGNPQDSDNETASEEEDSSDDDDDSEEHVRTEGLVGSHVKK